MRYAVPGTKIIFKISAKNLLIFLLLVTLIGTLSYTSISLSPYPTFSKRLVKDSTLFTEEL